ncbi:calcium activated cation channel [Lactifluus volemus]|nr:calcium activated cation channel [Lactifluus volemus]
MEETSSLMSIKSVVPTPDTLAKLIKRLRILTSTLLPLEVDPKSISDPTSRIVTPSVVSAYIGAAGDLVEALPYCLLRARRDFMIQANRDVADYGENRGRAVACEVLARKIVHNSPVDKIPAILSSRYRHRRPDGDIEFTSAIELAVDSHCTIFLSSSEAQNVIDALWKGDLVQIQNDDHDAVYVPVQGHVDSSFWSHFDPFRMAVPHYQNILRIIIWLFFLVVYSQAVREPLDRLDRSRQHFDSWEVVLYVMAFAFACQGTPALMYKILSLATWRALGFWDVVACITDMLLLTTFVLRVTSLVSSEDQREIHRLHSFQVLSFVSPFIWWNWYLLELFTVFDGFKSIGTMQICVAQMLRESGIFFALLSILGIGFLQGLYALDAADGQVTSTSDVIHVMVQSLLQSPDYSKFSGRYIIRAFLCWPMLYYLWNVATVLVLLNILISLFASAYSDVVEDAEAEYLAFFASKTVAMVRAPDTYVYPAPFNLVEIFFIVPLESVYSTPSSYVQLNRVVMTVLFFVPMAIVALYESTPSKNRWLDHFMTGPPLDEIDSAAARDPEVDGADAENGLVISKVPFSKLVKAFPNMHDSSEANIVKEIHLAKAHLETLIKSLDARKS